MRTTLIGLLAAAALILGLSATVPAQTPVGAVLGGAVSCNPALAGCQIIPLSVSNVCTANCPIMSQPSFTVATRVWGNSTGSQCRTSTDTGATWANCTSAPFTHVGRESYAEASDGSVLGTSAVGANCSIARSINQTTSWSTVYTKVGETCGGSVTEQTELKCTATGSCTFAYVPASGALVIVQSTDNGQNWVENFRIGAPNVLDVRSFTLNDEGAVMPANANPNKGGTAIGATWTVTSAYPASSGNCWGGFLLSTSPFATCYKGPGALYQIQDAATGTTIFSPTLTGALALTGTGGPSFGLGSNIVYVFAQWVPPSGASPIGVWLSRDSGATFNFLGVGSALANGMRGGDVWRHPFNGCIYISAGTTPQLMRVC